MKYDSISSIVTEATQKQITISQLVLTDQAEQMGKTESVLLESMAENLRVMREAVQTGSQKGIRSASGLTGGSAYQMKQWLESGNSLCGSTVGKALQYALAISETNACMGRIVAAPTAGSCGILPAALLAVMEEKNIDETKGILSLFTASAFGMVIANNASIAGASGGCQAECGSAAAMAAAALVELSGGSPKMAEHACAIALKNILGLVCDPVAGLVEIPCIKRNAGGVVNALSAAEMALAGIESAIPCDEVIIAMKKIGDAMQPSLKETAEGGLAATPTGKALRRKVFGD